MTHFLTQQGPAELIWHWRKHAEGFPTQRLLSANTSTNPPGPEMVDHFCLKKEVGIKRRKPEIQLYWT